MQTHSWSCPKLSTRFPEVGPSPGVMAEEVIPQHSCKPKRSGDRLRVGSQVGLQVTAWKGAAWPGLCMKIYF